MTVQVYFVLQAVVRDAAKAPSSDPLTEDMCPLSLEKCKQDYNAALARGDNQVRASFQVPVPRASTFLTRFASLLITQFQ